jgi:hypothetical protein
VAPVVSYLGLGDSGRSRYVFRTSVLRVGHHRLALWEDLRLARYWSLRRRLWTSPLFHLSTFGLILLTMTHVEIKTPSWRRPALLRIPYQIAAWYLRYCWTQCNNKYKVSSNWQSSGIFFPATYKQKGWIGPPSRCNKAHQIHQLPSLFSFQVWLDNGFTSVKNLGWGKRKYWNKILATIVKSIQVWILSFLNATSPLNQRNGQAFFDLLKCLSTSKFHNDVNKILNPASCLPSSKRTVRPGLLCTHTKLCTKFKIFRKNFF